MMKLNLLGAVVPNDVSDFYDWFGIDNISPRKVSDALTEANGEDLEISINSGGGEVTSASQIYTELKQYSGKVTVNVTGIAASAASVISMAGDTVNVSPTAQLMVHNASFAASGNNKDMAHYADILTKTNESIANAYVAKSGMSKDEALSLMDSETWLTAEDAVKYGLADNILFSDEVEPVMMNSVVSLPSAEAIAKFKQLIAASETNKVDDAEPVPKAQEPSILQQKLQILRGE